MQRLAIAILLGLSAAAGSYSADTSPPYGTANLSGGTAAVAFSPEGRAQAEIVRAIQAARRSIWVQAYGFSNHAIIGALVDAKTRGVDVRVIVDKSDTHGRQASGVRAMLAAGVPVWTDYRPAIAHNKVMILDGADVITGSFNFTEAAQTRNAENVLHLSGVPELAALYARDWLWREQQSRKLEP
jgi:phosphatidylserine/phosphatidylglycerophosphate/cardiolipin synthase-like enzyme